ncbi:hypothetical protein G3N95_16790 [Paraburkholderia sp. Tr-20389]|uniref:hypothetical protein n=1 Tax=Paraburkholderia sp. Tr-20389 TaxID=2703903 RepID=UPI0019823B8E|nr:hypothetical protein [Paraburkholderia sp. Tr-20389]MBN3754610.1 hypothetical protein [Paraburkholderia sp. Tr-20389]
MFLRGSDGFFFYVCDAVAILAFSARASPFGFGSALSLLLLLLLLLLPSLASALCLWFAGVAPVRGGTYFLCRRKESKQRKRAHTASPCSCLRAPNSSYAPSGNALVCAVASVLTARITRFILPRHELRYQKSMAAQVANGV